MSLAKLAVRRPVTIAMALLVVMLFGGVSLLGLPMDLMPNIEFPMVIVQTTYSGAGPREVETIITKPLESALGTVSRVSELQSISSFGSSLVVVTFEDGTNVDQGAIDLQERIDMIKSALPEAAGEPRLMKININDMTNTQVAVTSDDMDIVELKRVVDNEITQRYERLDGVASVAAAGGRSQEVQVELLPDKMSGYGVTEAQIIQLLRSENINAPNGTVKQGDYRLQLRTIGEFSSIEDIKMLPVTTSAGQTIYLSDVTDVSLVYTELTSYAYLNGKPAIMLTLQNASSANTVNVSDLILAENVKIAKDFPNLTVTVVVDQAANIRFSIANVAESLIIGFSVAILVLFFFLRNIMSTFIVGVAIPVSVVGTFAMMYFGNITLNMISLMGLTLGVGMLVDNSIVVLECIFRHFSEGEDRATAAINGAKEVAMAVTASTLTTVAVFLPIVFMGGIVANIFRDLSLTITFSLVASLFISLTFVPMLCALTLRKKDPLRQKRPWDYLMALFAFLTDKLEAGYAVLLRGALRFRKTVMLAVVLLFSFIIVLSAGVGAEFMPSMDMSSINVSISMPKGTLAEKTNETTRLAADAIMDIPEITDIVVMTGSSETISLTTGTSSSSSITVKLKRKLERERSDKEVAALIEERVKDIPGAEITVASQSMSAMVSADLAFEVRGEDLDELVRISNELTSIIKKIPGVSNSKTSLQEGSPEASIRIDRAKAASYGIGTAAVSSVVNTAVNGSVPTRLKIQGDEVDIRIRQSKSQLEYLKDIEHIMITAPSGASIPLSEIASVVVDKSPASIDRINQERVVTVTTSFSGMSLNDFSTLVTAELEKYDMPNGYYSVFGGSQEQMTKAFSALALAMIMAVVLIYMVVAAQFESLIHPFLIMLTVPVSMSFGILSLVMTGQSLNITSMIGLIMLAGIIVNNGIILIDYTNQLRAEGLSIREAVMRAGVVRLRPILMSALTAVLGMLPMVVNSGAGSEMMRPLAIVVAVGLMLGTLITLLMVPVMYSLVDETRKRRRDKREAKREARRLTRETKLLGK